MIVIRSIVFAALLAAACAQANAESCQPDGEAAFWAEQEFRIVGADLVFSACPTWFSAFRLGLSYYADDEYIYKGITGGGRIQFGQTLTPFVGLGVLAGDGSREIDAEEDGLDNNSDGFVDEFGEKEIEQGLSAFLYPELGLLFQSDSIGFSLSARRYYGSKFYGNVIFSIGLSVPLTLGD